MLAKPDDPDDYSINHLAAFDSPIDTLPSPMNEFGERHMDRCRWIMFVMLSAGASGSSVFAQAPRPFDFSTAAKSAKEAQSAQGAWAKHLKVEVETKNGIGMKLRLIPPGKFKIGSPESEAGRDNNEVQSVVEIKNPFWLGVTEVTQDQTKQIGKIRLGAFDKDSVKPDVVKVIEGLNTATFPAESLSWFDAVTVCNRLSELEGLEPYYNLRGGVTIIGGSGYRLPTEEEWEYAARAGTTTPFPSGKSLNGKEANVDGRKPYGGNDAGPNLGRPCQFAAYPANAFGLHDVTGNVSEWCEDWYAAKRAERADPSDRVDGGERIVKGGGWLSDPVDARVALRTKYKPGELRNYVGFRVARGLQ
jgi:formylglycine-generating enzyme required for sulfatase activity